MTEIDVLGLIKRSRKRAKISQSAMALRLGITQASYSRIENGKQPLDLFVAFKIATFFILEDGK